ncbi:MAG: zinc ribbon domain-containing protein [Oscillospiraceae bacterium]
MYCTKCGKQIPDTAAFCTECGSPVTRTPQGNFTQSEPQQTQYYPNDAADVMPAPKRSFAPAVAFAIGGAAIVTAAVAVIIAIGGQTRTPIASFYYASQNLTEDVLDIQSGSFSLGVGGESITGNAALSIDDESFEVYCNYQGADVAIYFENGDGAYYMSYPSYGISNSQKLDGDTIEQIREYFENLKTGKDTGKVEELDWKSIIENSELNEVIDPEGVPSSLKNLQKRIRSSKTRKELEKAMQIAKDGSTYSVPINSETICDTLEIVLEILQDECQPMFIGSTLDDLSNEYQSNAEELRNSNINLGSFDWELDGKRFTNISMNFNNDGENMNFDFDFKYKGNSLDDISANIYADGESMNFSMSDINNVKEVIPESIRSEME